MPLESSQNDRVKSPSSSTDASNDTRSDVFICYSRKDGVFAASLVTEIRALGKRVVFDVDGIRGGETWRRKLGNLIEYANNMVVLISADSLTSQYCRWELDYANTLNKRLIPVLVRSTDLAEVPESVRVIQWIDAIGTADVTRIAGLVVAAIEEDQSWAEYHTQLGLRAMAWKESGGGGPQSLRTEDCGIDGPPIRGQETRYHRVAIDLAGRESPCCPTTRVLARWRAHRCRNSRRIWNQHMVEQTRGTRPAATEPSR